MSITPLTGMPPLPVPVLPESFDLSLSYMELLTKCWNQVSALTTATNTISDRVTAIEQAIGDLPQLSDAVAQLQLDLAAEIENRQTQYNGLYNQINGVRNLVIADYVSNEDLDAVLAGGIKFILISKSDYDALTEYDQHTIYCVVDGDRVTQYFRGNAVTSNVTYTGQSVELFSGGQLETITGIAETEE